MALFCGNAARESGYMNWENLIEHYFEISGFEAEWAWMNRESRFILVWKGRSVRIYYVDIPMKLQNFRVSTIKVLFFDLIGYLQNLDRWQGILRGRNMEFKWLSLIEPTGIQVKILKDAGVESFIFKPEEGLFKEKQVF